MDGVDGLWLYDGMFGHSAESVCIKPRAAHTPPLQTYSQHPAPIVGQCKLVEASLSQCNYNGHFKALEDLVSARLPRPVTCLPRTRLYSCAGAVATSNCIWL
jgi:hypothetical protein